MIQLTEDEIFAVPLPDGAKCVEIGPYTGNLNFVNVVYPSCVHLDGKFKLLFTTNTVDEEKAKMVVEPIDKNYIEGYGWEHYMSDEEFERHDFVDALPSALLSFNSLLRSKVIQKGNYAIVQKVKL